MLTSCTKNSIRFAPEAKHADVRFKKKILHLLAIWVELFVMIDSFDDGTESFEMFPDHIKESSVFMNALRPVREIP